MAKPRGEGRAVSAAQEHLRALADVPDRLLARLANSPTITEEEIDHRGWQPGRARGEPLTPTQRMTLQYAAEGLTVAMIAEAEGRSRTAVADDLKATRYKLGAKNTSHAVALALRQGLIE